MWRLYRRQQKNEFNVIARVDTPVEVDYLRNGGILQTVLRKLAKIMRILLTNDDGIYAEGIYAAYKELIKFADVTVVAPDSEQSSVGHGITLFYPLFVKKVSPGKPF